MTDRIDRLQRDRIDRLGKALGRPLDLPSPSPADEPSLAPERRRYLLEEAEELYHNELEWEHLTEEERLEEGALTELAFPGFLAFVRGLLLEEALPDAGIDAEPHPEVVVDIVRFLSQQAISFQDDLARGTDEEEEARAALSMTLRLMDLVLLELDEGEISAAERERVEAELATG